MSHLACPYCGKNSALSTWDPENYDDDIQLVNYEPLGFGKGFRVSARESVLGDKEITPRIVNRSICVLAFCVKNDEEIMKKIVEGLPVIKYLLDTGELVPVEKHWDVVLKWARDNRVLVDTQYALDRERSSSHIMLMEKEAQEKELALDQKATKILKWFWDNCDVDVLFDDDFKPIIVVNWVPIELWDEMKRFSVGIRREVVERLKKRMYTKIPKVEVLLKEYLYKRRKTYAERLLEDPRSLAY